LLTKYLTKLSFSTGALCFYNGMLREPEVRQQEMELVTIESLVPADHLLRKIDAAIDLEFIRERVRHLYWGQRPTGTRSGGAVSSCC
jgi:hypothetical protein